MPWRLAAFRWITIFALGVCGAILADDLRAHPVYCGFGGGCDEVLSSPYGHPFGVPLSLIGAVAFSGLLALTTMADGRARALMLPAALLAGAIGATLILVQLAVLRRICALCFLVDLCAVALAGIGNGLRGPGVPRATWRKQCVWLSVAALTFLAPLGLAWLRPARPVPEEVQAHWLGGKITIVEVTDFDCPHCRVADSVLSNVLANHRQRVHFVRFAAAQPAHVNSRPAARAYLAAISQGKGEAMAVELFRGPRRTAEDCRAMAESLGLDLHCYDRDVSDLATDATIDATGSWAKAAGPGLPLIWVQDHFFYGVPAAADLRGALRRVERRAAQR